MNYPRPLSLALICVALFFSSAAVDAGSATWNLNPTSSDWNTAANWTPNTVPNGPNDVATFAASNQTDVTISASTEVNELIFSPGASDFTINVTEGKTFTISGTGIMNNSGIDQNFLITKTSHLDLTNSATVGELTFFSLLGGTKSFEGGGAIFFLDTSSAGNGTFVVNGAENDLGNGASVGFSSNATAGNGTFTAKAGSQSNVASGLIFFVGTSTAGDASFVIEGAGTGGSVAFFGSDLEKSTAGNGIFNINGSSTSGGLGGFVQFSGGTAGSAAFITNPGTNGGSGGYITFLSNDESEARFELFGGALLAEFAGGEATVGVGSIEGDGLIQLSALGADQKFITGSNDLSTTFSGTITDLDAPRTSGSLEKIGNGTLTLSGANTYDGGTTIEGGNLLINNRTGSATGKGLVQVNAGGLGGRGTVGGAVVVGEGSGLRAALVPRRRGGKPDTLTIQSQLTFNSDGIYRCKLNTQSGTASKVVANGVIINAAQFSLLDCCGFSLSPGTVLTVIDNTSADPISGTFSNLPDGGTITAGNNTFQADYEGGDGNDLTLTVL
jgi:fibronectin-binding autotransporter adhesin